jgi:hypothetical protein
MSLFVPFSSLTFISSSKANTLICDFVLAFATFLESVFSRFHQHRSVAPPVLRKGILMFHSSILSLKRGGARGVGNPVCPQRHNPCQHQSHRPLWANVGLFMPLSVGERLLPLLVNAITCACQFMFHALSAKATARSVARTGAAARSASLHPTSNTGINK